MKKIDIVASASNGAEHLKSASLQKDEKRENMSISAPDGVEYSKSAPHRKIRKREYVPAAGPERDEYYMNLAIREARKALKHDDVPIGCIIVYDGTNPASKADQHAASLGIEPGTILGRGYNRRNRDRSALMHAEVIAIRQACRALEDWRVEDCTMYVTLEPCPMCAGAIVQARVPRVVIGSMNPKAGCCGSVLDMLHEKRFNHRCEVRTDVEKDACGALMSDFFAALREQKLKKLENE